MNTRKMVRFAIVAALYAVTTMALPSYTSLQIRVSEILTLLAFVSPFYVGPLTLGCVIANTISPFGLIDVIWGSFSSFLALKAMSKSPNIYIASIWPSVFSSMIGFEIYVLGLNPGSFSELITSFELSSFLAITLPIMASQFIIVAIAGIPVFKIIEKNTFLMDLLKDTDL